MGSVRDAGHARWPGLAGGWLPPETSRLGASVRTERGYVRAQGEVKETDMWMGLKKMKCLILAIGDHLSKASLSTEH